MGELHDAIKILRDMAPMLDPTEDYLTIAAAEEQMSAVAAQRAKLLEEQYTELKALTRALDAARTSSTRPPTVASEEQHAQTLNELDALRLSLAKSINDADGVLASREAELARLREQRINLETRDAAREHQLDGTALRLAFYKGLGFEPIPDKNGRVRKMLVRSDSGEVHYVTFEDDKSEVDYTRLLWTLASS